MKKYLKFIIGIISIISISAIFYSCSQEKSTEITDTSSKILYDREQVSQNEPFTHYRTIKLIEKISANNTDFQKLSINEPTLKNITGDILKYTYDGDIVSYKVGNIFYYSYENNLFPIKTSKFDLTDNLETITISDPKSNKVYYKMTLDTQKSTIHSFEKINYFPLEKLGFDKNSTTNVLNKREAECDDLAWSDCMDCTVEDCGRHYWCVALLVAAGPETLAGMAVSCTVNQ